MNLQTFIDALPGYLWSDGNGSASGLAVTAELFLLSIVPGMVLAVVMAVIQCTARDCWPGRFAVAPGSFAVRHSTCN